jgi:DNA mismatch repair ATPase MutS
MLMHFPLKLATFWDWHQFAQLGRWKRNNPGTLLKWLDAFREMEVLSCFANAAYNHPGWTFPEVMESGDFILNARTLGHPLLREDHRVCNDLQMEGKGRILLVTGSNMAGKSTFLRTVGINMVLALAGGPACAEKMKFSRAHVISSMRIADNLEENISTFYAELKKLEIILKKVRAHEPVFLLLDEILRGTNSLDRHAGARALIRTFVEEGAVGILATHDLELTGMEKELPEALVNYHFDVQVQAEELFFDYKLKPGICTSMNASLLMRKIGIEV